MTIVDMLKTDVEILVEDASLSTAMLVSNASALSRGVLLSTVNCVANGGSLLEVYDGRVGGV